MAGALEEPLTVFDTPATSYTREVGFSILISASSGLLPRLPIVGDVYSATEITPKIRLDEFASYVCTKVAGSGKIWRAYFHKAKTTAEAGTPFRERVKKFGNFYWHPILHDVEIVETTPRAIDLGDSIRRARSWTATPVWTPSADTGTVFIEREFFSPTEFQIPQHETPMPAAVSFHVPGQGSFSFGECLHRELPIQAMVDSDSSYDPVGVTVSSKIGLYAARVFKATNMTTWTSHIIFDSQTQTASNAWHRVQLEAQPPPLPLRIRGNR